MSLFDFLRLIYRNFRLFAVIPPILAATVYFLTSNMTREYRSSGLIYTGMGSGYNIESGSSDKVDYKAINAAYDNMMSIFKSRFTLEEAGLRLLALNLSQEEPNKVIGVKAFDLLKEEIPLDKREAFVIKGDLEKSYENLKMLYEQGHPVVVNLIRGRSSYSIEKLQSISITRVKSSDMISVEFTSYDPGICKNTLDILLQVFSSRYKQLKEAETGNVVAYFEAEMARVKANLIEAEDNLTRFRVKSRVINYGEETKALAIKKQNAHEEYAIKTMNLKATEAGVKELEEKLKIREKVMANNVELVNKKAELANITSEISKMQAEHQADSLLVEKQSKQIKIKQEIERLMMNSINQSSTKEGISGQQLVTQWLQEFINFNHELVTVQLYKKRLNDIDNQYDQFTPMGSTIDRMERQISVYEREYLEVLHGLNMSKLRQQNIEMSTNLEVLDAPTYPLEPLPSKRSLLIIVGFMVGVMGVLGTLIAADLLDSSIRHPERAKKVTGMDVAGVLPVMEPNFEKKYGNLAEQVTGIMASKIKLDKYTLGHDGATVIGMISTLPKEGKTFAMKMIFDEMVKTGESVCLLTTQPLEEQAAHCYDYNLNDREALKAYRDHYRYILVELPAWVEGKIPVHIIENTQLLLWAMRADMVWSTPHINMKEDLEKITKVKPTLVINGVKTYHLDQVVGEVPMQRSFVNKLVRKIVKFEFGSSGIKTEK